MLKKDRRFVCIEFILILLSIFLLFVIRWFANELFDAIFILYYYMLVILILFYIAILILLLFEIIKNKNRFCVVLLIVFVIGFIFNVCFPFQKVKFFVDFEFKFNNRNKVVNYIKNNDVKLDENGLMHLSSNYMNLSSGGNDIVVYKNGDNSLIVIFYIFRGLLSEGSKMLVYSDGVNEVKNINERIGDIASIDKVDNHWYYVVLE